MRAMRQRAAAVLRPGAGPPSTDAEEEAAEVLAQLKVLQARGQERRNPDPIRDLIPNHDPSP